MKRYELVVYMSHFSSRDKKRNSTPSLLLCGAVLIRLRRETRHYVLVTQCPLMTQSNDAARIMLAALVKN